MTSVLSPLAMVWMCIFVLNCILNIVPVPSIMYFYCVKLYVLFSVTLSAYFILILNKFSWWAYSFMIIELRVIPSLWSLCFELISHGKPKLWIKWLLCVFFYWFNRKKNCVFLFCPLSFKLLVHSREVSKEPNQLYFLWCLRLRFKCPAFLCMDNKWRINFLLAINPLLISMFFSYA